MENTVKEGNLYLEHMAIPHCERRWRLSMELVQGAFTGLNRIGEFPTKEAAVRYAEVEYPTRWINQPYGEAIKPKVTDE